MSISLVASAVSRWADDPWSGGSWSLIGRDGSPRDRAVLGSPVGTRLRLAGEATHPTRAGMTHGAYEQGLAAATWATGLGHRRVGVVGAGMAGLAAARELTARGVDVQVWEARDRLGGRAAGVDVGGFTFDLGANWLQQYSENALAAVAAELGLTVIATDFTDPLVLGLDAAEAGPLVPGLDAAGPEGLDRELRARLAVAPEGAAVADVVDAWLREPGAGPAGAIRRLVDAEIVMDSGAPLTWLSARYGFEPGVGEGDRWIVGSFRQLVEHLAGGIDVRLGRAVRRVEAGDDEVRLVGDRDTLRVDAAIVTVPVAVLAGGGIEFEPPLPGSHRAALGRLGMGRVEKVVLRFDRRFWPVRSSGYYRVHGPGDGSVSEWLDATDADGTPTLVGLFAGPWLDNLWSGPDAEVAARAARVFADAVAVSRPSGSG